MPWAIKNTGNNQFSNYDDSNSWCFDVNDAALYRSKANAINHIKKKLRWLRSLEKRWLENPTYRSQMLLDLFAAFKQAKVVRVELTEIKEI